MTCDRETALCTKVHRAVITSSDYFFTNIGYSKRHPMKSPSPDGSVHILATAAHSAIVQGRDEVKAFVSTAVFKTIMRWRK